MPAQHFIQHNLKGPGPEKVRGTLAHNCDEADDQLKAMRTQKFANAQPLLRP
jgi:hypothetical protein